MHTCVGGGGEAGTLGQVSGGSALQQTEWALGRADGGRAGSESAGQWDRGAPAAGGQESGAQKGDGRAWIGKNLEAARRSQRRQAAQAGEERWKPGGRPAVRPAGPGFAEMLRGLGSHSEELSAAPCGRSAPLRSPHVLS